MERSIVLPPERRPLTPAKSAPISDSSTRHEFSLVAGPYGRDDPIHHVVDIDDGDYAAIGRYRIAAIVLSTLAVLSGSLLCALPACVLAFVPERDKRRDPYVAQMYVVAITLSIMAIVTTIVTAVIVLYFLYGNASSSTKDLAETECSHFERLSEKWNNCYRYYQNSGF